MLVILSAAKNLAVDVSLFRVLAVQDGNFEILHAASRRSE
jgi:hypothetical protein